MMQWQIAKGLVFITAEQHKRQHTISRDKFEAGVQQL